MTTESELKELRTRAKEKREVESREREAEKLRAEIEEGSFKGKLKSTGKTLFKKLLKNI